jgi:hypothetical protein
MYYTSHNLLNKTCNLLNHYRNHRHKRVQHSYMFHSLSHKNYKFQYYRIDYLHRLHNRMDSFQVSLQIDIHITCCHICNLLDNYLDSRHSLVHTSHLHCRNHTKDMTI